MAQAKIRHVFVFILLSVTWGSSFILMKKALRDPQENAILLPAQVAALRMCIAATLLLPVSIAGLRVLKRSDLKWLAVVGLIGSGIPAVLFTTSQQYLDSSVAGILNALTPVFTLIVGIAIFRKPAEPRQVMGVLIGLGGAVSLIALQGFGESRNGAFGFFIAAATLSYGISVNVVQHRLKHVKAHHITAISLLMAAVPYGIYLSLSGVEDIVLNHPYGWSALGYVFILSAAGTVMANMLYFWLTQQSGALFASSVTYVMPLVAVMWGLGDKEHLTFEQCLAGLVILTGVWLVNRKGKAKA